MPVISATQGRICQCRKWPSPSKTYQLELLRLPRKGQNTLAVPQLFQLNSASHRSTVYHAKAALIPHLFFLFSDWLPMRKSLMQGRLT